MKAATAWAWMLENGSICRWASPDRRKLSEEAKPSPGAKIVSVYLVKRSDFQDLRRGKDK